MLGRRPGGDATLELHLLRHADAGNPAAWDGPDAGRPLSKKGRRQAERLAAHLAGIGFAPDAIISSPKIRARETAELVADALGHAVRLDDRLASGVGLATLERVLADAGGPTRPLLVGHDPDLSDLLSTLVGAAVPMRKGAIARVDVHGELAPGAGVLRWLLSPDLLG